MTMISKAGVYLKDDKGNVGKINGLTDADISVVNSTITTVSGLDAKVTDAVDKATSAKSTADSAYTMASSVLSRVQDCEDGLVTTQNRVTTAEADLASYKTTTDATLTRLTNNVESMSTELTETSSLATVTSAHVEEIYLPMIQANQQKAATVVDITKDSQGKEKYSAKQATTSSYGAVKLMDPAYPTLSADTDAVPYSIYKALEERVAALEAKVTG